MFRKFNKYQTRNSNLILQFITPASETNYISPILSKAPANSIMNPILWAWGNLVLTRNPEILLLWFFNWTGQAITIAVAVKLDKAITNSDDKSHVTSLNSAELLTGKNEDHDLNSFTRWIQIGVLGHCPLCSSFDNCSFVCLDITISQFFPSLFIKTQKVLLSPSWWRFIINSMFSMTEECSLTIRNFISFSFRPFPA